MNSEDKDKELREKLGKNLANLIGAIARHLGCWNDWTRAHTIEANCCATSQSLFKSHDILEFALIRFITEDPVMRTILDPQALFDADKLKKIFEAGEKPKLKDQPGKCDASSIGLFIKG